MTACKNKLEAYGFKIVLAREQSGYYPSNDYLYRVQRCIDQGAQAFVSFHINSGSSGAHGAEVYAPTANGTDYTQVSVELANKVMNNLAAMGLTYRGVFQMEVGDEFAVIAALASREFQVFLSNMALSRITVMWPTISRTMVAAVLARLTLPQSSRSSRIPTPSMEFPSRKNWDMRGQR